MGRAGEWRVGELNPPASSTEVHSCPLGPLRPLNKEGGLIRVNRSRSRHSEAAAGPSAVEGVLTT